jgi:hypothetical protein
MNAENWMIFEIIAGACASVGITTLTGIGNMINRKPFNCTECLAFWSTLLISFQIPESINQGLAIMGAGFISMVMSHLIKKLIYL